MLAHVLVAQGFRECERITFNAAAFAPEALGRALAEAPEHQCGAEAGDTAEPAEEMTTGYMLGSGERVRKLHCSAV